MDAGAIRRLFIGVPVDLTGNELAEVYSEMMSRSEYLRVVPFRNHHITLRFIGPLDPDRCTELCSRFRECDLPARNIQFELKGLGAFPSLVRPGVLWCGIDTDGNSLMELHGRMETLCEGIGLPRDSKSFSPHLTLARVKKKSPSIDSSLRNFFKERHSVSFGRLTADRVVLFESRLARSGAEYVPLISRDLSP